MDAENVKPVALVLGGTDPHIALIARLKERGYTTVLIDYLKNPPARESADQHVLASTLDSSAVLDVAVRMNAALIVSACVDQANKTACHVSEALGLPHPYSAQVAANVTDKVIMKRMMVEGGIPTSRHYEVTAVDDIGVDLKYPVVVKPADSNGSLGVRKVSDAKELKGWLADAIKISRSGGAIVEEFFEGEEFSVDCIVSMSGEVDIVLCRQKYKMSLGHGDVMQSPGSFSPGSVSDAAREKLAWIAERIASTFNLSNTPLLLQVLINNDDVSVIEFAPRVGGGLSYRTVKINAGVDLIEATIDSYLGHPIVYRKNAVKRYVATIIIYSKPCIFHSVSGVDDLIADGTISEFHYYKKPGAEIGGNMSTRSRIGAFIVDAPTKSEMVEKVHGAVSRLESFDQEGQPTMIKSIYQQIV